MVDPIQDIGALIRQAPSWVESIRLGPEAAKALVRHPRVGDLLRAMLGDEEGSRVFRAHGFGVVAWFRLPTLPLFIIDDGLGSDVALDSGHGIKGAAERWRHG